MSLPNKKQISRHPALITLNSEIPLILLLITCFLIAGPNIAAAEESNPWTHSFYFENDLFTGTDQNYTNGVKYTIISQDISPSLSTKGKIPKKILSYIHKLPFIKNTPPETAHKVEFSLGQNMYTPQDISRSDLILEDRPYAGWTYLGTSYHRKSSLEGSLFIMDSVEIQLGIIGPASFAEESQTFVHDIRDLPLPKGWDHQLSNEPGVVLAFERKWLFHPGNAGFGYSAIAHTGFALGNVSTYANAGLETRLGWNIPRDFGVSLIRPAGSTRMEMGSRPGFYLLCGLDCRLVARNIFLDGNTFSHSHSVPKEPVVGDFVAGAAFTWGKFMATFTQVLRTKQFKGQDDHHSFGAISLSWFFTF